MKPGDKLWYVPNERRGKPHEVTVVSVGRKWITFTEFPPHGERDRCTLEEHPTGGHPVDGRNYTSPGVCYVDRAAYETKKARTDAWHRFKELTERHYVPPDGITTERIRELKRELYGEDA